MDVLDGLKRTFHNSWPPKELPAMSHAPFRTFLLVGTIAETDLPSAVSEVCRRLDKLVCHNRAQTHELAPRIRQDLYREFPREEVDALEEEELESCYA